MRLLIFLLSTFINAQSSTPFLTFEKSEAYALKRKQIEVSKGTPLDKTTAKIVLAATHKNQDDLIEALSKKIEISGETAPLRYRLGGANGIRALQVAKFFSIPYVKAMLKNFHRAVAIDSTYTPAIEAAVESLCKVPSVLGGDLSRAKKYAELLSRQNRIEGYFAKGFIAHHQKREAIGIYKKAFEILEKNDFCQQDLEIFFQAKSLNFPYKIAEISATYQLHPSIGICAIDYFIANSNAFYNLPMEWVYYRKGQLFQQLGNKKQALESVNKALEINPNFTQAMQFVKRKF